MPNAYGKRLTVIRDRFLTVYAWFEVYDFLEFMLSLQKVESLERGLNYVLERELSGYRFIEGKCTPITNQTEIASIKEAISESPYEGVRAHFMAALDHMSRRENPDFRNSIKESISAVESLAKSLTGKKKATLDQALNWIEKKGLLHGALKKGMSSFYGYTSDEDGIRHAILEERNIDVNDARFFLVACSAFTNYVISKYEVGGSD